MPWAPYEPNGSEQGDNCIRLFVRPEGDLYGFVVPLEKYTTLHLEENGMICAVVINGKQGQSVKHTKQLIRNKWSATTGPRLVAVQLGSELSVCTHELLALHQKRKLSPCKEGFTQFGKGCFKTVGGPKDSEDSLKSASEAQQACKILNPYAELAILRTKQYEQFATALIKGFRNPLGTATGPWIVIVLKYFSFISSFQFILT